MDANEDAIRDAAILTAENLTLEPMTSSHAVDLFHLFQDPDLQRWTFRDVPTSVDSFRDGIRFLESRLSRDHSEFWLNWIFRLRSTNQIAGKVEVSLDRKTREANLAYYTFGPFQRKDYAREACAAVIEHIFSEWNCRMIYMEMDVENLASFTLAEGLDGVRVKLIAKAQEYKGRWHDEFRYELRNPLTRD